MATSSSALRSAEAAACDESHSLRSCERGQVRRVCSQAPRSLHFASRGRPPPGSATRPTLSPAQRPNNRGASLRCEPMRARSRIALLCAALALYGCDRNLEPYDPAEQPRQPDLSRIFPAGAERAERAEPGLPAAPAARGTAEVAAESGAPIHATIQLSKDL